MPYRRIEDLPPSVADHLPPHAQEIFLGAFNHAWDSYSGGSADQREERAFRIAWAAVKRSYRKRGDLWIPINT